MMKNAETQLKEIERLKAQGKFNPNSLRAKEKKNENPKN